MGRESRRNQEERRLTNNVTPFPTARTRGGSYVIHPEKKVAIVGFASSSRDQAPFADESFEIWGLNSLYALIPRFTRWFEIHPIDHVKKDLKRGELLQLGLDHYTWLKGQPGPDGKCGIKDCDCQKEGNKHEGAWKPIYMQNHYEDIPASVPWPRQEINDWTREMFGPEAELDYFTSTPGEMVAQAVFEGYGEIQLYGIDLLQNEEYAYQRPGLEYWTGIARGLGIKVVVSPDSCLHKANYVYGYTEPPVAFNSLQPLVKFFDDKNTQMEQNQHQCAAFVNATQGARQAFDALHKKLNDGGAYTAADILKFCDENLADLAKKFELGQQQLMKLGAQRELAASASSWIGHYGRGGLLEGMTHNALVPQPLASGSSEPEKAGAELVVPA